MADATPRECEIDGCQGPHLARGWCRKHYLRWQRHGDPLGGGRLGGGMWRGDDAGYVAVHGRLYRRRGLARVYSCAHCGAQAGDWAYDQTCPNEKVEEVHGRMMPFSTDLDRYMPLCRSCHLVFDRPLRRLYSE